MITIAIGDIHGMISMLDRLLIEIDAYARQSRWIDPPRFVFLGDYVDRGDDSRGVVKRVRALQARSAVCLRGNHEALMSQCRNSPIDWQNFLANGGVQTLASYKRYEGEFEDDRLWMSALRTSYEDDLRIFVHAGILPGIPLEEQTDETKMWAREKFLSYAGAFPKYVVHGHTPITRSYSPTVAPEIFDNRCNLDTGACYGGALTAAFFSHRQAKPFHVIGVV